MTKMIRRYVTISNVAGKTIEEFCDRLKKKIVVELPNLSMIESVELTSQDDYDSSIGVIEITYSSPQTEEEQRLEVMRQEASEKYQRRKYLELKAKFEKDSS